MSAAAVFLLRTNTVSQCWEFHDEEYFEEAQSYNLKIDRVTRRGAVRMEAVMFPLLLQFKQNLQDEVTCFKSNSS